MKGKKRRRHTHYGGPPDTPVEELAAQLAPAEERDRKAAAAGTQNNHGAIVVDAGGLSLPEGFGAKRKSPRLFEDRVVIVIVALLLTFTAFVAWRVSKMSDEPTPVRVIQE